MVVIYTSVDYMLLHIQFRVQLLYDLHYFCISIIMTLICVLETMHYGGIIK
jgi:hypothetical protein